MIAILASFPTCAGVITAVCDKTSSKFLRSRPVFSPRTMASAIACIPIPSRLLTTSFIVAAAPTAPAGFTLTTINSGGGTVLPGAAAAFNLLLGPSPETTYPDALTLSASGLPAGATATFSPATIPAGSGATAITMTIQTTNPQTARNAKPGGSLGAMTLALLLLPVAGMRRVRRRLRKMPGLPVVLAAAALSLGAMVCLSGCGSSGGFFNQAPKSYTVVVTATDTVTGAHSSTNVTLTVQ